MRDDFGEDGERDLLGRDRADVEADGRAHLPEHLFVSGGVGTSIIPVRFRVPPEIVILKLEPAS